MFCWNGELWGVVFDSLGPFYLENTLGAKYLDQANQPLEEKASRIGKSALPTIRVTTDMKTNEQTCRKVRRWPVWRAVAKNDCTEQIATLSSASGDAMAVEFPNENRPLGPSARRPMGLASALLSRSATKRPNVETLC